jgi:hypothetical protein
MMGVAWALVSALAVVSTPVAAPAAPAIRLAPVRCPELPDATIRTPLRVELGKRLVDESAADEPDFLLLSIACSGSDATLLAVRQSGGVPARRLVPLQDVAPEARAREVALAAAELVRVSDARGAAPPQPAAAPAPAAVATVAAPPAATPAVTVTYGASLVLWGGYLSTSPWAVSGGIFRLGVELGDQHPQPRSLKWALAYEVTGAGGGYETVIMNGLLALVQLRGGRVVPELGVGGRLGAVSDFPMASASTLKLAGGPLASLAVNVRFTPGLYWDVGAEAGYDFNSHGAWVIPRFGLALHY